MQAFQQIVPECMLKNIHRLLKSLVEHVWYSVSKG